MTAPKHGSEPIDRRTGLFTREWYAYLTSLVSGSAVSDRQAASDNLTALSAVEGWGVLVRNRFGILVRRLTSSTLTITNDSGADGDPQIEMRTLANTGVGAGLYKITRDTYGRVEGTAPAAAVDLPYDNATSGFTATDTQAAIDEAAGALPYFSATAPDPAVHPVWVDTTDGVLYLWYDDGTGAQWVEFGSAGGSSGTDALTPYYVADGSSYSVPLYKQVLFTSPIELDGTASLEIDGLLIEVD